MGKVQGHLLSAKAHLAKEGSLLFGDTSVDTNATQNTFMDIAEYFRAALDLGQDVHVDFKELAELLVPGTRLQVEVHRTGSIGHVCYVGCATG